MHIPPVTSRQPLWTRGKDSPNPFGRFALRASRTFHPTPSRFATAPEGHGERFPRTPSVASLRIT